LAVLGHGTVTRHVDGTVCDSTHATVWTHGVAAAETVVATAAMTAREMVRAWRGAMVAGGGWGEGRVVRATAVLGAAEEGEQGQ